AELAGALEEAERGPVVDHDAGGVVAAVLEALEPGDDARDGVVAAGDADDPAHGASSGARGQVGRPRRLPSGTGGSAGPTAGRRAGGRHAVPNVSRVAQRFSASRSGRTPYQAPPRMRWSIPAASASNAARRS